MIDLQITESAAVLVPHGSPCGGYRLDACPAGECSEEAGRRNRDAIAEASGKRGLPETANAVPVE